MSIAVVVKKGQHVAIGSDTLTRLGSTRETAEYIKNHSKIIRVGTSYLVPVGPASSSIILSSYFSGLKRKPILSDSLKIFEEARKLHQALKERYFLRPYSDEDAEFEDLRMRCLIANPWGIFGLYNFREVRSYTKFYAFGSGYKFALGAMRAVYDRLKSAEQIAKEGLEAATDFDDACARPVEIKTIKLKRK